ncbi:MAG: hypothetical protein ACR2LK_16890 [Solirubrobacteraceae bacterium]
MSKLRCQRGQATIDYVALIAVLALLVAPAAAVVDGAPGVVNSVLGQLRRALCIVQGGHCPAEERRPCVVAGDSDLHHAAVTVALLRVDKDRYVLRERLSDGTVRLTVSERDGAGVEGGVGARARLKLKGRSIGIDREARGTVQGVIGHGKVFVVKDDREADKLLRSIERGTMSFDGPDPQEVFFEGGVRGIGRLGLKGPISGLGLDGVAEAIVGARRDQRTGEVAVSLSAGAWGWALLSAARAGPLDVGPSGLADGDVGLVLRLDRTRRPIGLSLNASGTVTGGSKLPFGLAEPLGVGAGDRGASANMGGRRWEVGARVDLRDPSVAAAWKAFRHNPTSSDTIRALGDQLRERAHVDVRSYAVRSQSDGGALSLALGLKLGGEVLHTTDRSTLLSAVTRPPGGLWEPRLDCV